MDEIWQRHKNFILQCAGGGFVFLIALFVKSSMYSGADDPETMARLNKTTKDELQQQRDKDEAPNSASIEAQRRKAEEAMQQISELAGEVASTKQGKAYVRENIGQVLQVLGTTEALEPRMTLYLDLPQACLTRLVSDARSTLVGRAAEKGMEIDESLGLAASYEDDEVPTAIHGLAIVAEVLDRCLASDGIDSVPEISVQAQSQGRRGRRGGAEEVTFVKSFRVLITLKGLPQAVTDVLRSFNRLGKRNGRMIVIDSVDALGRERADSDVVKCTVTLLGLQHLGLDEGADEEGGEQ